MASRWRFRIARGRWAIVLAMLAVAAVPVTPTLAKPSQPGFKTAQASMLSNLVGGSVMPIISVGDTIGDYRFEAIPDGIAVRPHGRGTVDVFVNHETSTVPFPYSTTTGGLNDFTNSLVSRLKLHQQSGGVMSAAYVITDAEAYHRFCSSFIVGSEHGFERPLLLTNEEGTDWVNREGMQWPATVGDPDARQIGLVVAHDVANGNTRPIWGMGRHNHENSVGLPGYGYPVVLSGDDTFTSNPPQSQVYSYIADSGDAVWNDEGDLWAFVSDDAGVNDYYDFAVSTGMSVSGHFVKVPKEIATGRNPDGTDMMAADVPASLGGPYPLPQDIGHAWANSAGTTTPIDGPQWVLERWSDLNNVFQFIRIEDMAYDKRPGESNVLYLADSGRGSGSAPNGRIWRMEFDPNDPTEVTSLSILIEGDDNPVKTLTEIRQPDNLETTVNGLYVTEDPGSSQQFAAGDAAGKNARVWQYRFSDGNLTPVLEVNQAATPTSNKGAWEASGIIDVSSIFGPGSFLVDVQAHTLFVETAPGPDLAGTTANPDWTYKREGGQLLLVTIPGG